MSAIESLSLETQNRRAGERLSVAGTLAVIFGRGEGVLIDLSQRGARIRHRAPVRRGASVRVTLDWEGVRFSATAEILASRLISIGAGPSYESRMRFTSFDEGSAAMLEQIIDGITGRNVRRWVANLHGWNEESKSAASLLPTGSYIRCRLHGAWWERKITSDSTQPQDGFLLPSEASDNEIETLCDTYSRGGDEERQVIRVMATAAVEHSLTR
ncbi:MAG TPA: PilZ domain-containing protein [Thermoanaerobaculia bacterium]|jgi:hypothetical protein|nr:PilZ domain-containing protein [Thermoanaerobaculia bacterium]